MWADPLSNCTDLLRWLLGIVSLVHFLSKIVISHSNLKSAMIKAMKTVFCLNKSQDLNNRVLKGK